MKQEISDMLDSCSPQDMHILLDVIKTLKISLDKYN